MKYYKEVKNYCIIKIQCILLVQGGFLKWAFWILRQPFGSKASLNNI
jgi:hypothetical protein